METVKHTRNEKGGSFFIEVDGRKLAEMVYVMAGDKSMIIEHTEVDKSLRGQNVGKKLLVALVDYVRSKHILVVPLCPFAKASFQKVQEWQDVLQ
jgi:uncharacterized protein